MESLQTHAREQSVSPIATRKAFVREVLVSARQHNGMSLLVDGLAGMGKTYMLRELTQAATDLGTWHVSFVRADEIESGEPYSFIERLVAGIRIPDWFFQPEESTLPVDVARECIRRLVSEGDEFRLIVIDDAQWMDVESQRVLRYLIPRVTRRGVLLAFGVRSPHQPGSFGEFLETLVSDSPFERAHYIAPLTTKEITSLILERHGVGIPAKTAQRILDVTGGTFLEVDSMLQALTPADVSQLHQAWDAPIAILQPEYDPLLFQFNQLDPETRATSSIVMLAGHELTRTELAGAAAHLGERVALDEAVTSGLLVESGFGASVMPRHALLASAITQTLSADRSQAVHAALAEVTSGYRSLKHTLWAASAWTPDLLQRVNEFVTEAVHKGNLQMASELLRVALSVVTEPEDRVELLESLALIHVRGKNSYLILDLLETYEELPPSVLHEFITIVLAAHQVGQELPQDRVMKLLMSSPETPDDQAVLAFFSFMVVILTMRSPNAASTPMLIARAKQLFTEGPVDATELNDQRLGWMVDRDAYLLVLDSYLMVQDQQAGNIEQVAEVLPDLNRRIHALADSSLKVDAIVAVAAAELAVGNLQAAHELAQIGDALLDRESEPWASSTARLLTADLLVLQGRYSEATDVREQAEEIAYSALDVEARSAWAALQVIMSAITGDPNAETYAKQSRRQTEFSWEGYAPDLGILAECELARVRGDHETILRVTSGAWADQVLDTRHGFLTFRAHSLIATGQLEAAEMLIDQLAQWRGTRWHEYWGTLDWLRACLAGARGDVANARWHFEAAIDMSETPLPRALTLADYADLLIAVDEIASAREALQRAQRILVESGAQGYLPRIERMLETASTHPSAPAGSHLLAQLTEREQQIAQHLATGRSNNQIAESLVVSVTTVRSHVSNVLRKLKLSSRAEVAQLIRESSHEDAHESARIR